MYLHTYIYSKKNKLYVYVLSLSIYIYIHTYRHTLLLVNAPPGRAEVKNGVRRANFYIASLLVGEDGQLTESLLDLIKQGDRKKAKLRVPIWLQHVIL